MADNKEPKSYVLKKSKSSTNQKTFEEKAGYLKTARAGSNTGPARLNKGYPVYTGSGNKSDTPSYQKSSASSRLEQKNLEEEKKQRRHRRFLHVQYSIIAGIYFLTVGSILIAHKAVDPNQARGSGWFETLHEFVWETDPLEFRKAFVDDVLDYRQSPTRLSVMGPFKKCNQVTKMVMWRQLTSYVGRGVELSMMCKETLMGNVPPLVRKTHNETTFRNLTIHPVGQSLVVVDSDITTEVIGNGFSGNRSLMGKVQIAAQFVSNEYHQYKNPFRLVNQTFLDCLDWYANRDKDVPLDIERDRICEYTVETMSAHNLTLRKDMLNAVLDLYDVKLTEAQKVSWFDSMPHMEKEIEKEKEELRLEVRDLEFGSFGPVLQIVRAPAPSLAFAAEYMIRVTVKCVNETRPLIIAELIVPVCFAEAQKSAWIRVVDGSLTDTLTAKQQDALADKDVEIVKRKHEQKVMDTRAFTTLAAHPAVCTLINAMQGAGNSFGGIFKHVAVSCVHVELNFPLNAKTQSRRSPTDSANGNADSQANSAETSMKSTSTPTEESTAPVSKPIARSPSVEAHDYVPDETIKWSFASPIFLFHKNQYKVAAVATGGFRSVAATASVLIARIFGTDLKNELLLPTYNVTGEPRWIIDDKVSAANTQKIEEYLKDGQIARTPFRQQYPHVDRRHALGDPNFREVYMVYSTAQKLQARMEQDEVIYVQRCHGCTASDQTGF